LDAHFPCATETCRALPVLSACYVNTRTVRAFFACGAVVIVKAFNALVDILIIQDRPVPSQGFVPSTQRRSTHVSTTLQNRPSSLQLEHTAHPRRICLLHSHRQPRTNHPITHTVRNAPRARKVDFQQRGRACRPANIFTYRSSLQQRICTGLDTTFKTRFCCPARSMYST
jgi:hypothetical protein